MKKAYLIAGLIAAGSALAAGTAIARDGCPMGDRAMQERPMGGPMMGGPRMGGEKITFESLDTDGNGEISRDEAMAKANAQFGEVDANGDGMLDAAELTAQAMKRTEERMKRMVERLDKDGDGVLSAKEMPRVDRAARMFDVIDSDDSGTITVAEFDDMKERMQQRHRMFGKMRGEGHFGKHGDMHRPMRGGDCAMNGDDAPKPQD